MSSLSRARSLLSRSARSLPTKFVNSCGQRARRLMLGGAILGGGFVHGATSLSESSTPSSTDTVHWYDGPRLDDADFVKIALQRKGAASKPLQSQFRVLAVLRMRDATGRHGYVLGVNSEQGFIGGSICAERAAATQLRLLPDRVEVDRIFLVSDLPQGDLTPGVLCREFLLSQPQISRSCQVVMICTADSSTRSVPLKDLYPHACLFSMIPKGDLLRWGRDFPIQLPTAMSVAQQELYREAVEMTAHDSKDEIHPVRLAAGVLFEDGTMAFAAQQKALEYGNTLDAVSLLAPALLQARSRGLNPQTIIQVDQHGIMHAPFAPARSFLYENDFDSATIFVHEESGKALDVCIADLVPDAPRHIFD